MEAVQTSGTLVNYCQSTRHYDTNESHVHNEGLLHIANIKEKTAGPKINGSISKNL
jgi:hypothetical protein